MNRAITAEDDGGGDNGEDIAVAARYIGNVEMTDGDIVVFEMKHVGSEVAEFQVCHRGRLNYEG